MAESEIVVFMFSVVTCLVGWGFWLRDCRVGGKLSSVRHRGGLLSWSAMSALLLLYLLLRSWSAHDVRNSLPYLAFYWFMGAAWIVVAARFSAWLGISLRDDVVERRNGAASLALSGAVLGITACFAGGNIGDGPGWWVVIFSAALATSGLFLAWLATEIGAGASEAVTVDRDSAAGLRLGALLLAAGLVLGRSVAGNWQSPDATIRDFVLQAYPVAFFPIAEIVISRTIRLTSTQVKKALSLEGLLPAAAYLTAALMYIRSLGPWQ